MTKMHFEAAATQVRYMTDRQAATTVATEFAKLFAYFNPRFDRAKFFAACGTGSAPEPPIKIRHWSSDPR